MDGEFSKLNNRNDKTYQHKKYLFHFFENPYFFLVLDTEIFQQLNNLSMKKFILTTMASGFIIASMGQWVTSGANIINTNFGNVGIGTTGPTSKLSVVSTTHDNGIISGFSKTIGTETMAMNFYGYLPTSTANTYLKNTYMIWGAGASFEHLNIAAGMPNSDIRFLTGGWNDVPFQRMVIDKWGFVAIGFTVPSQKLDVNGSVRGVSFLSFSDERFKTNIRKFENPLEKLMQIQGVRYQFNKQRFPDRSFPDGERDGLLAQQVQKVFPELVVSDSDGFLSVDYISMIPILIESIKELNSTLSNIGF